MFFALAVNQDSCLFSQSDIWSSCWCIFSGVSGLWGGGKGDSDTAVAAEWNQWWMTCQTRPRCLLRRLYWQAHFSNLTVWISRANPRSCWLQMLYVNITLVIAHLSTSHLKAGFCSRIKKQNLLSEETFFSTSLENGSVYFTEPCHKEVVQSHFVTILVI